ncbi:divalent-cation tolerance protein CutA [Gammaproteobacteria bacterium AB-CW1]|uniref:Divalent-cation tolerance protein CutA n=1 Tax=Natronospira elongata TaxID=3110268 RepID=A0AAP6MN39_9GAMM|nr:divalent-cation tolerance protein CutA [Gammaproteobacteria bacterium AB-CW1]
MSEHCVIFCTCPDEDSGRRIAGALVAEKLAACANLIPGLTSIYEWKGKVETDPECLLVIKTAKDRREALIQRIPELHPYEVPEVIALPIEAGLNSYLDWLSAETRP